MDWKEFLNPDKRKMLLTLVLTIIIMVATGFALFTSRSLFMYKFSAAFLCPSVVDDVTFGHCFFDLNILKDYTFIQTASNFFPYLLIPLLYLLSCVLIFTYEKIKKQGKLRGAFITFVIILAFVMIIILGFTEKTPEKPKDCAQDPICLRDLSIKQKTYFCDEANNEVDRLKCFNFLMEYYSYNGDNKELLTYKRIESIIQYRTYELKNGDTFIGKPWIVVRNNQLISGVKECEDCEYKDWDQYSCDMRLTRSNTSNVFDNHYLYESCLNTPSGVIVNITDFILK